MKRMVFAALVGAMVLVLVPTVTAQVQSWEVISDHYRVISEVSEAHASEVADLMEAMMELYNRQFRFAVDEVEVPLRVRVKGQRGAEGLGGFSRGETRGDQSSLHATRTAHPEAAAPTACTTT